MLDMKTAEPRIGLVPSVSARASAWPIAAVAVLFLWWEAVRQLQSEWSFNPQYGYGWSVPFLTLYLFSRRWSSRPMPGPSGFNPLAITMTVFGTFLLFPIRFLSEANPDWRLLSWALALIAATVSLAAIFFAGGWPWLRHFCFPILFFLVAVPWPVQIEQTVIQNLMRMVTATNVVLLNLAGVPAIQHGNLIEVGSGLIGIEEACSGVRSLQATLMVSLFLGELYLFKLGGRIILIVAGALLAFFCNIIRTAILVWMGAKHGMLALESWHDPAGLTILFVCLFGLWFLSLGMRRFGRVGAYVDAAENSAPAAPTSAPESLAGLARPGFWPLFAALAVWMFLAEAATQAWYGFHQSRVAVSRWTVQWPVAENRYEPVPVAPEAQNLLRYNEGGGARWHTPDGHQWMIYSFRWLPGRTAALFVKIHRPDICLPASGLEMKSDNGIQLIPVNGVHLPIRSYRFDDHGMPLHVFYCYWDARSSYTSIAAAEQEDWSWRGRLRAALRGSRELGAQMLELVVWGYHDDAEAAKALQHQLTSVIRAG
jgi:exosortase